MLHAYPAELARAAVSRWQEISAQADPGPCIPREGALPEPEQLERLLSMAYQASLLQEEERPVRFRLFVGEPDGFPAGSGPPEGLHALRFVRPRSFDEHEIRRLSPAAKYHRALIGVRASGTHDFEIWGILQSGPRWLQSARGGRAIPLPIPGDALVIRVVGPGRISVAVGDVVLAELRSGRVDARALDLFQAEWLIRRFRPMHAELLAAHEDEMRGTPATPLDPLVTRKISQQLVKHLMATIRESHHGGTVVFLPHDGAVELVHGQALTLKYAFAAGEPRLRYHTLMRRVLRELALASAEVDPRSQRAGWSTYRLSTRPTLAVLDEAILEMSQLLAALCEVDGAVVLTDRFEVLGFGGEIVGHAADIQSIRRALDLEGTESVVVPIDGVGTRHRSAYRLCAEQPGAMAIVVSQDGGVQFIASLDGQPTYWEHAAASGGEV
ncbi:MAG: DNA integrity scanning protein DisA nucleotide-binding domain protein [Myxococcales bacterium]|nr:DNA integrity scanning protein DisA nucleotide-binding domain protein [Myxococcales bacterium]